MWFILLGLACGEPTGPATGSEGGDPPAPGAGAPGSGPMGPMMGPTRVAWFTSAEGRTWTRAADDLTEKFVSLGLSVRLDGTLWLSGIDQSGLATAEEQIQGPRPEGFIGKDGSWTRHTWDQIRDPDVLQYIDPQWDGDSLWYISRKGGGDPKLGGGRNEVRSTPPTTVHYSAPGIADPSPVTFQGQRYVFITGQTGSIVQLGGQPLQELGHWAAVTVPFATVVGDELWLLGQHNLNGRRQPVLRKSKDGRTWPGEWQPMVPPDSVGNCTSPVLGPWGEGYILLCVDEDA